MTEEETRLASAHIQEDLAKHPAPKRKGSSVVRRIGPCTVRESNYEQAERCGC